MRAIDPERDALPREPGAYVLVFGVPRAVRVRVGRLGPVGFGPGFYCYVGSARGGLASRLARHLRRRKRKRWHVDYLAARARVAGLFVWPGRGADECALSRALAAIADGAVDGFGASDCRCRTHLHFFARDPKARLRRLAPR